MNVYLAGKFQDRDRLRQIAEMLRRSGHHITSRWLFLDYVHTIGEEACAKWDHEDILASDAFVLIDDAGALQYDARFAKDSAIGGQESVGRYVELGIAITEDVASIAFGPKRSIFHHLVTCYDVYTAGSLIAWLEGIQ